MEQAQIHSLQTTTTMATGVKIHSKKESQKAQQELFTNGALRFLAALHRTFKFESTRQSLLVAREDCSAAHIYSIEI